jgi:myo-inositol-1(or 4)-monophosphatase
VLDLGPNAAAQNAERLALTELLYPRVQRIRMIGTAATALTWVAAGHFDATVMFSNKPWDTMAGVAIAREAGVVVLDLDGSSHAPESRGTFAVSAGIREPMLELIAQAML